MQEVVGEFRMYELDEQNEVSRVSLELACCRSGTVSLVNLFGPPLRTDPESAWSKRAGKRFTRLSMVANVWEAASTLPIASGKGRPYFRKGRPPFCLMP